MSIVDRLASPPTTRMSGVAWASAAAVGFVLASFGLTLFSTPGDSQETLLLISNLTGLLGVFAFLALLRAVHAAVGRRGVPAWLLPLAYALLLARAIVLVPYFVGGAVVALPAALAPIIPILFFALAGAAAACAAISWMPATPESRTPLRIAVVGLTIGIVVTLMLLTGTGLVLIVVSLALAVMNAFRKPAAAVDEE